MRTINHYLFIFCYNHSKYMNNCIQSALFQTKKVKRIIICDDISTDNTISIINNYKNKHKEIDLIVNKEKKYHEDINQIYKYFNNNFQNNDFFTIISGDDFLELDFVEENFNVLSKNNKINFIFSSVHIVNKNNQYINKANSFNQSQIFKKHDTLYHNILYNRSINSVPFVYNLKLSIDNNLLKQSSGTAYDFETLLKITRSYDVYYINKFLSHWRRHIEQESFNKRIMQYKSDYLIYLMQKKYHASDQLFNSNQIKFYHFRNYLLCIKFYENRKYKKFIYYFIKSLFSRLNYLNLFLVISLFFLYPFKTNFYINIRKRYLLE